MAPLLSIIIFTVMEPTTKETCPICGGDLSADVKQVKADTEAIARQGLWFHL